MKRSRLNYSSPISFTPRQRITLTLASNLAVWAVTAIEATCKREQYGRANLDGVVASRSKVILATWHETMVLGACFFRHHDIHSLASYSYDGELAARVARGFGIEVVRGSTSRGGVRALRTLEKAIDLGSMIALTVDGPRGPRRELQSGVAYLAARTQIPIVPMAFAATKAWRLDTWDRFWFPKPFGRIGVSFGEPIYPPENRSSESVETLRIEANRALNELQTGLEAKLGCARV